jgi:hypothetical protein
MDHFQLVDFSESTADKQPRRNMMAFCSKCGTQIAAESEFCGSCGMAVSTSAKVPGSSPTVPVASGNPGAGTTQDISQTGKPTADAKKSVEDKVSPDASSTPNIGATNVINPMDAFVEHIGVLRQKISKSNAYLGVLIGTAVFVFTLFLSWSSIPTGISASDGGSVSGWSEKAYLAIIPLLFALYPVLFQKAVHLKKLLISIAIAFFLLGFDNVICRKSWNQSGGDWAGIDLGSTLGAGFWIGLLAMVAISACGIAWSLHTSADSPNP